MSLPVVKRWTTCKFKELLSNTIGSRVDVSSVSVDLFNSVSVDGLLIYDRQGEKMLDINRTVLSVDLLPLVNGVLRISSVKILNGDLRLTKESSDSEYNCQFLIDSLSSKDENGGIEMQLRAVVAKNLRISYDVYDEPAKKTFFDNNHIRIDNLNCSILFENIEKNVFFARVRSLNCNIGKDISIKQFYARVCADKKKNSLNVDLKNGVFATSDILASLHNSRFLIRTDMLSQSFPSLLTKMNLRADVKVVNRRNYDLSFDFANSRNNAEFPIETRLSVLSEDRQLVKAHAFMSSVDNVCMHGEYDVNLIKKDVTPFFYLLKCEDVLDSSFFDNLRTLEQKASFKFYKSNLQWTGYTKTNLGELALDFNANREKVSYSLNLKDFVYPILFNNHNFSLSDAKSDGVVKFKSGDYAAITKSFANHRLTDVSFDVNVLVDNLQSSLLNVNRLQTSVDYDNDIANVTLNVTDPKLKASCVANVCVSKVLDAMSCVGRCQDGNQKRGDGNPEAPVFITGTVDDINAELLKPYINNSALSSFKANSVQFVYSDRRNFSVLLNGFSSIFKDGAIKHFNKFSLVSKSTPSVQQIKMLADSCMGELVTNMSFSDIYNVSIRHLVNHFPSLHEGKKMIASGPANGFANLKMEVLPGAFMLDLFKSDVEVCSPVYIDASISHIDQSSGLSIVAPCLKYKSAGYNDVSFYYKSRPDSLLGAVMFSKLIGNSVVRIESSFNGDKDVLLNDLRWEKRNKTGTYGSLLTKSVLTRNADNRICCDLEVLPSKFFIKDTLWNISPCNVSFCDNKITVNKFSVSRLKQFLNFSASLSDKSKDVYVDFNDVEISYILGLLNFSPVEFSGRASGVVQSTEYENVMKASLGVKNFGFNTGPMGELDLNSIIDLNKKTIGLNAKTHYSADDSTLINGSVDIGENKLDLSIKSEKTNLQFLNKYVRGFVSDLEGTVSGDFRLFGDLKYVNMEGSHRINYMKFRPKMLNVLYSFENDSLHIRPDTIDFNGMVLHDPYGNSAKISGSLNHHSLFNFDYNFKFLLDNLLLINWEKSPSRSFWGQIFTDGPIKIHGDFDKVHIGGELSTSGVHGQSMLYYNSESSSSYDEEKKYIRFVGRNDDYLYGGDEKKRYTLKDNNTDVYMNFKFNVNSNASLNIITDPVTDDYMVLNGSGPLSLNYYNKGRFLINGVYTIEGGSYKLTIKDVIRKNFAIQPGGYLRFNGDLSEGDISIKGVHKINSVSLSDLNVGASRSNSTVGADCILNFTGKTSEPKVSFGLDFPNANSDENKIIKNILLTEEDRNMQAIYLLSIGRFYTYNYNSVNTSGQSQSSVAMNSFLAGTLSGQINNLLQDAFHVDNWNFDTNIATGRMGWTDMEVQGALSGKMFNNRLLFNGNIGYRDQITSYSNNFVGNFNLRWFLNNSGSVSLKAYSETNDRYFTKSTLTTQGAGIMFRKDFYRLHNIFFRSKK